jgi:nitroreductase
MLFLELAKKRYSTRSYKEVPVEREKLEQVLETGRIAPSAGNRQPLYFVVATDDKVRKEVASTYRGQWIRQAPAIIVVCGDHSTSWKRGDGKDHCDIDAAIAADHMTLAAAELGLGTCWICAFDAKKCRKILQLPKNVEAIALLPIGYPDDQGDPNRHQEQRKKMEDIVVWNGFDKRG